MVVLIIHNFKLAVEYKCCCVMKYVLTSIDWQTIRVIRGFCCLVVRLIRLIATGLFVIFNVWIVGNETVSQKNKVAMNSI